MNPLEFKITFSDEEVIYKNAFTKGEAIILAQAQRILAGKTYKSIVFVELFARDLIGRGGHWINLEIPS